MSGSLINKVKKTKTGHPITKVILFYLADCMTEHGCWPSQKRIAHDLEISVRTVIRHLNALEQGGFITRKFEYFSGEENKTFYSVLGDSVTPKMGDKKSSKMGDIHDKWVTSSPKMGDNGDSAYKDNLNDNRTRNKKEPFLFFEIPQTGGDPTLWKQFLEMRYKLKKPMTEQGYELLLGKLKRLSSSFDFNERLAEAIDRKWAGLVFDNDIAKYPLSTNGNGHIGCDICRTHPNRDQLSLKEPGWILDLDIKQIIPCECRIKLNGSAQRQK